MKVHVNFTNRKINNPVELNNTTPCKKKQLNTCRNENRINKTQIQTYLLAVGKKLPVVY